MATRLALIALLAAVFVAACSSSPKGFDLFPEKGTSAVARLIPKNGSTVTGTIAFNQRGEKVAISTTVNELTPGLHSVYIHQTGNCSSPNAASAGRVWEVAGAAAGGRARIGELPQIVASADGTARMTVEVRGLTVGGGGPTDVLGHAVVVHAALDPDPRPEFGVRNGWLACGVIERR